MFGLVSTVLAQSPAGSSAPTTIDISSPGAGFDTLAGYGIGQIASWLITMALVVAGIVFFFMLVVGGIRWILSGGDKANTEGARNQITAALIGLIIVFSAWAIATLLNTAFGVNILNLEIPGVGS